MKSVPELAKGDALERLAAQRIDGRMAERIVRFQQLNPEQKLAYVLERLLSTSQERLELLKLANQLAPAAIEWKKQKDAIDKEVFNAIDGRADDRLL